MKLKSMMKMALLAVALFVIAGCQPTQPKLTDIESTSQELKKFSSEEEIIAYLEANSQNAGKADFLGARREMAALVLDSAAPMAKASESVQSSAGASDYSQTNVQVEGVDEADFVKNDGTYIYQIVQDKLVIIEAFPAEDMEIVSETELDDVRPRNLYVNGDKAIVIADGDGRTTVIPRFGIIPEERYKSETHVIVFDVSNRENPKEVHDFSVDGWYVESRMIGEHIYLIAQDSVYYYNDIIALPMVKESSTRIMSPDVYYFDNPEWNYVFNTVASIDINGDENDVQAKTFMMGYSGAIYVSENNIYISYQKNLPWRYYEDESEQRFYDVAVPLLPADVRNTINSIRNDDSLNSYEKWQKISDVIEDMYNSMDEDAKEELIDRIQEALDEHEAKLQQERQKTVIHRIAIGEGSIEYGAKGEVPGYLLNQFSMDEHNSNLRVATTSNYWTRQESVQYNNVYVLSPYMDIIGKKEGIAAKERIYSTRFLGDRLYMVTFRQIDPFFVIDLSNPSQPDILGELKIPGFSNYLHPYDEDHIIGVGQDTKENEWGGVSTTGVKLALFDVSDVSSPRQLDQFVIGEQGTYSEALNDHKAFLFSKEKNLLVIPAREVLGKPYFDDNLRYYREKVWQGAYVFSLDTDDGFQLRGKVTHAEDDEQQDYWYGSPTAVRRSLYMDDMLYTVSDSRIMANDLETVGRISSVELPWEKPDYGYPVPLYKGTVGVAEPGIAVSEPTVVR
jgi:uncharacterized secreted protein with C-terminal beta-propeller domain